MKVRIKLAFIIFIFTICFALSGQAFARTTITDTDRDNSYKPYTPGNGSDHIWDFGYGTDIIKPKVDDGITGDYYWDKFTPCIWVDRNESGEWYFDNDTTGTRIDLGNGPNPDSLTLHGFTNKYQVAWDVTPADYGGSSSSLFLGWTIVNSSSNSRGITGYCSKKGPALQLPYVINPNLYTYISSGNWANGAWDFWWRGWTGRAKVDPGWDGPDGESSVHVEILDGGTRARITRTVDFSSKGYNNYPIAGVNESPATGDEFVERYGAGKSPANVLPTDPISGASDTIEHRVYGAGEYAYLLIGGGNDISTSDFKPASPTNTINFGDTGGNIDINCKVKATGGTFSSVPIKITINGPNGTQVYTSTSPSPPCTTLSPSSNYIAHFSVPKANFSAAGTYNVVIEANYEPRAPGLVETSNNYANNKCSGTIYVINQADPPDYSVRTMYLKAALKHPDDLGGFNSYDTLLLGDYLDDSIVQNIDGYSQDKPLKIKSGYGIPLTAEISKYNFKHIHIKCCHSEYRSFYMDNNTNFTVTSTLDGYWNTNPTSHPPAALTMDILELFHPGDTTYGFAGTVTTDNSHLNYEKMRGTFKSNSVYPLNRRQIYAKPSQPDGLYTITVKATVNAHWQENMKNCPSCACPPFGCCCSGCNDHWVDESDTYEPEVTLYVKIQDSMFDDDQGILIRPTP